MSEAPGAAGGGGHDPAASQPLTKRGREAAAAAMRKPVRVPLYSHPMRTDAAFVCEVVLIHEEADASVWTERGVACLCCPK